MFLFKLVIVSSGTAILPTSCVREIFLYVCEITSWVHLRYHMYIHLCGSDTQVIPLFVMWMGYPNEPLFLLTYVGVPRNIQIIVKHQNVMT